MRIEWLLLARYAEEANGLLTIVGAGWDRIIAPGTSGPIPEEAAAIFAGAVVTRLLFDDEEAAVAHAFEISIRAVENGWSQPMAAGEFRLEQPAKRSLSGVFPANLVVQIAGAPLPSFGHHEVVVQIDGLEPQSISFQVEPS